MKKTYLIYSISILMIILFPGCDAEKQMTTSTTQPLPPLSPTKSYTQTSPALASPYRHYPSVDDSNFYLGFEYPSSWLLYEEVGRFSKVVVLYDPRFAFLPTPSSDDFHPTPNDFGVVRIRIVFNESIDIRIEEHRHGYKSTSWVKELNQHEGLFNGYNTSVFEYQIDDPESHTSTMFERNMFFAIKDQTYQITFMIAEKDRNSEFEQGYEHFLNSIQIVP